MVVRAGAVSIATVSKAAITAMTGARRFMSQLRASSSAWINESTSAKFQMRPRMAASPAIDRGRLREETPQDVIDQRVIILLKARVRNPRHHRKMLIGIRQAGGEGEQITKDPDAIPQARRCSG